MNSKSKITFLIVFLMVISCNNSSKALTPEEATDPNYLKNKGHTSEVIHFVDVQKARANAIENTENKPFRFKIFRWHTPSKPSVFVRNLFIDPDLTKPLTDFGAPAE